MKLVINSSNILIRFCWIEYAIPWNLLWNRYILVHYWWQWCWWILHRNFKPSTLKTQYETTIDGKVIASGERVFNSSHVSKIIHGTKCYGGGKREDVNLPLCIIAYTKLNLFKKDWKYFTANLCMKYQKNKLFMNGLI